MDILRKIVVYLGLLFLLGCASVPITGRKQLSFIPMNELASLSEQGYKDVLAKSKLSQDSKKLQLLNSVGKKVADAAEYFLKQYGRQQEISNYQWEFNLIEDDKVENAFCLSGGKIAVYTGILKLTKDSDGLACVIAHEVAHALANHGGERMSQLLVAQLGGTALAVALNQKPQETQRLWMSAYGLGAQVGALLPYSRMHEREADRIGLILMAKAGYDPNSALAFWERMSKKGGNNNIELLSTHPVAESRIEDIRRQIPEALKYYKK